MTQHARQLTASRPAALTFQASAPLTAADTDPGTRTITGMVIPYGVTGMTSAGPTVVDAGALQLPEDLSRIKLTAGHFGPSIGYGISAEDSAEGLTMAFKVGPGEAGDQALAEASPDSPVNDGLSIEIDSITWDETTDPTQPHVTAAILRVVAQVPVPAFDDARVTSVAAAHHPTERTTMHCQHCGAADHLTAACPTAQLQAQQTPPAPPADSPAGRIPAPAAAQSQAGAVAPGAAVPAAVHAAAPGGLQGTAPAPAPAISTLDQFYAALAVKNSGGRLPAELSAALSDITQSGVGGDMEPPQIVGELWDGVAYVRKIVPLFGGPKALTSYNVKGWRWVTKPEVAAWTGDKAAVPSNAVDTESSSTAAERLAGAHDIDRKFRDFNDTAFFQAYYEAMTESYAIKSDAQALSSAIAFATAVNNSYVSDGILGAIATGVQAIGDATNAASTFVVANMADLVPFILGLTNMDLPAFLDLLGIDPRRIVTHSGVAAGKVLVGAAPGMDYYELPGSPIRVEAIDMVKGGVDAGVFGYHAEVLHDATALQLVDLDAA